MFTNAECRIIVKDHYKNCLAVTYSVDDQKDQTSWRWWLSQSFPPSASDYLTHFHHIYLDILTHTKILSISCTASVLGNLYLQKQEFLFSKINTTFSWVDVAHAEMERDVVLCLVRCPSVYIHKEGLQQGQTVRQVYYISSTWAQNLQLRGDQSTWNRSAPQLQTKHHKVGHESASNFQP